MSAAPMSRRAALTGIGLAGGAAILPIVAASAAKASTADRAAWDRAFAAYEKASAAEAAYAPTSDRIWAAFQEGKQDHLNSCIDWKNLGFTNSLDRRNTAYVMDVEAEWQSYLDGYNKWWFSPNPDKCRAQMRAALDSVVEFRRREAEHRRACGWEEAAERTDALSEAAYEAKWTLLSKIPAPDLPALLWKLEVFLQTEDEGNVPNWTEKAIELTMADARRLLSGEA